MDEKKNDTAETPAFKAPENAPVRRVGTLTLGVCLIVCGVLFLCYFFVPHFNWELALKIAPAAGLILLGCEVLYFAAKAPALEVRFSFSVPLHRADGQRLWRGLPDGSL